MTRGLTLLLAALALSASPLAAQPRPLPASGTGTIYVGSYSGHITAVDEASGTFS